MRLLSRCRCLSLSAERVDFIATYLCEIAAIHSAVFGSSQYRVVSEFIARGEIGFYLTIFGGSLLLLGHIIFAHWIAFICILFHYMLGLVSKSEVMKRTGKFQVFGECLHNVAFISNEILIDFYGDRERKDWFNPKIKSTTIRIGKGSSVPLAHVCSVLHRYCKQ